MATNPLPPSVINIDDLRKMAKRRLPRVVFDYLDGVADSEITLRESCRVFDDVLSRPRWAVAVPETDIRSRVLSFDLSFPAILAPVGYSRMMHTGSDGGECAAAAAAGDAGPIYTLSPISGHPLENVRAATKGPAWYQLYLVGGREIAEHAIDRAKKAGFTALVVTLDPPVAGLRERDPRNGMKELLGGSLLSKLPYVSQFFARPSWFASFLLDGGTPPLANVVIPGKGPMPLIDVGAALSRAVVTWKIFVGSANFGPAPSSPKAFSPPTTPAAPSTTEPLPSSFRITVAASSTLFLRRFVSCRKSSPLLEVKPKSCSTAASAVARTSSKPSASALAPSLAAALMPTVSALPANPGLPAPSKSSAKASTAPSASSAAPPSSPSIHPTSPCRTLGGSGSV